MDNQTNNTNNMKTNKNNKKAAKPAAKPAKKVIRRPGSGRTKGAVSLVTTNLGELNRLLKPDATVTVGRKWLESLYMTSLPAHRAPENQPETESNAGNAGNVEVKVHDLSPVETEINTGLETEIKSEETLEMAVG